MRLVVLYECSLNCEKRRNFAVVAVAAQLESWRVISIRTYVTSVYIRQTLCRSSDTMLASETIFLLAEAKGYLMRVLNFSVRWSLRAKFMWNTDSLTKCSWEYNEDNIMRGVILYVIYQPSNLLDLWIYPNRATNQLLHTFSQWLLYGQIPYDHFFIL